MKVLIVSQYFWPEQFRINDLSQELKKRGHQVSVLTGMPNYPEGRLFHGYSWWKKRRDDYHGVPVFRVPLFLRRQGRGWQLALNYLSFVVFGCLLAPWYFRKCDFDIIFVYEPSPFTVGIPAILMRYLKRAPMLFWVQDLWPESLSATGAVRSPSILKGVGEMVRAIYKRCDRVLVQSKGFIEPAVAAGAPPQRTIYFPNWAEDFYQPLSLGEEAPERGELPSGFRVMFAGNMGEAQSLETIVATAGRLNDLPDLHWVMIGDGRRRQWLEDEVKIQGLSDHFHFPGRKPAEVMPRYFSLADALLVTLRDEPAFARTIPSKVQSYLACGRPVVAALNGEGAEVVERSGGGLAVAAGDAEGLAAVIRRLYAMTPEQRQVMGSAGRTFFENEFAAARLISQLETWMVEVHEEGLCES